MTPHGATDAMLAAALGALPVGIWVFGPDQRLAFANAATEQLSGLPAGSLPPDIPLAEVARHGLPGHGDAAAPAAEPPPVDRSRPVRHRLHRADGACFEQMGAPLPDGGFVAALLDVTGHVAATAAAEARARLLEALLAQLRGGIAAYDPQRRVRYSNPAYEDLLGLPRGVLHPGTSFETLFRMLEERGEFANLDPAAVIADRRAIDRSRPVSYQRVRPNGEVVRVESQPLPEGGYLVELVDITAVKRAEDEAQRRAALLDGVLASLPNGVVVYGADRRVAMVNAAHQAIMAGAGVAVGEHHEAIVRRRAEQGEYGPGDPLALAAQHLDMLAAQHLDMLAAPHRDAPPQRPAPAQRIRPDGTALDIRHAPMPDGGTVQVTTDITALHVARAEVAGRAAQLQVMLDGMRHGIALYDAGMRLVVCNALAARLTGLPPEAMRPGRHILDLVREQAARGVFGGPEETERTLAAALAIDRRQPSRRTQHRPDGTIVEVVTDPTPDGGYVVIFNDVTARAQAEEAARTQAAMLQLALESMRHGFILCDAEARIVAANSLAASCCGLGPGTLTPGTSLAELVRRQHAAGIFGQGAAAAATVEEILAPDRRQPYEATRSLPDGRVVEVRSASTPDGSFVLTLTDITDRARAESKAEQRATVLQVALESMQHGFVLYDAEARLVAANALGARYSSLAPEDMVPGRTLAMLLQRQRAAGAFGPEPGAARRMQDLLALDRGQAHEYRRPTPDGRILEIRSAPTEDGGFVVTQTDITALAEAEAAARERADLLQAMLDNMRHGLVVFGPDHRVRAANELCSILAGMAPGTVRPGRGLAELVADRVAANGPFEPAAAAAAIAEDLGLDRRLPHRRERPNAHGRMVSVATDPLPDGGFVISYVDTTEVNAAKAEAQHRALLLQTMQDSMRHGIALFGPDQRLIVANRLAAGLAGLPPEELVPGITPEMLAQRQLRRGVFGEGPAAAAEATAIALRDRSRSHPVRRRMPDGRVVDSVSDPTPDGGFVITWTDVTAQVAAEAAAAERTATLQAMIDTMHHGVVLFGPGHRFIADNRLARELTGLPDSMIRTGARFAELSTELFRSGATGDATLDASFGDMAAAADRSRPLHYTRPLRDGRTLEVFSDPMPDGGFIITLSDITPLARAEAEAKRQAATQAVMLDVIRHGIALFGHDRRLVAANRLASELSGVPADFLRPGMLFDDAVRHQHAAGVFGRGAEAEAIMARALGADRSRTLRYHRRVPDGRLIEVVSDPTPDGGFALTYSDITALAAAEAAAASRAATLQAALDHMRHGLLIYGPDRRLQAANALAAELADLAPEDLVPGTPLDAILRRRHAAGQFGPEPRASAVLGRLLKADRGRRGRRMRHLPDGRLVEVFTDPTPDGGFVVSFTDITARARAEEQAKQRAAMLRDALDSMRHGLMMFGPDRRLLTANRLAGPDYGLPDLRGREGVPFETLVAEQARAGEYGEPGPAAPTLDEILALDRTRPARYRRRRADGMVIEVGSDPTPDGGFVVTHTDVTELARAQDQASARAAVLQLMLDNMRHGIAHFDHDGRLVTANRLAAEFNGIDPALLQPGVHARELAQAVLRAGMITAAALQAGLADDYARPQRRTRVRPDGRVIEIFTDPTPDGGFVATYSDVTALTAAEAEARERARIQQVMLDNLRHGIQLFDADQRLIAANRLAADLTGYPAELLPEGALLPDLIGIQLRAGAIPGDPAALQAQARSIDRTRPARYVRPHRDGRVIEVTSDPTPGGGFVITMTDISALARAEAEAQHRAGVLQAMLDNIRHGIALFDAAGRIQAVNPVLLALLDLPGDIMRTGGSFEGFVDYLLARGEYGPDEAGQATAARLKGRDRREPSRSIRTRPNGVVLEIASEPVPGGGFVLALTDVTEDRRIRDELEAAKDAAEAANRAKSRFLATMSHELRTPLNAVIGFSEALGADPDPVRGKEYVRSIHEAGRHLLSLIDDILDVTRAETIGFSTTESEVQPVPLIEGTVRVMQATAAAAGVVVAAALPPALPRLRADELRLRQVLLNLVSNAVKFTPQGGLVTVSAEVPAEGGLVLRVADSGIGIKPEDIPRAFEPFTQLDSSLARRFPGSGLGLYLSRALAEAQGATLTLESIPGAGTTAILRFPKSRLITSLAA